MLAIEFHPATLPVVEEENNDTASIKSTEESKFFIIFQVQSLTIAIVFELI